MTSATSLKSVRLTHRYIRLFVAPTILFFTITGGLQMFGLHETARGSSYVPPNILVHLSRLHKKGTLYLPRRKVAPSNSTKSDGAKPDGPKLEIPKPTQASPATPPPNSLPTKIFFAATVLALAVSTCTGIMMAWKYARRKSIALLIIAAGVLIPAILLFVKPFPIRPLLREAQMTQSSFCNVLEYANRESKCLTMIHATSARRG
jgi:hypothetical protein